MKSARSKSAGFSIVELMIVLVITLVIAAFITPYMVHSVANIRLRGAMTSLAGMFQNCRALSIKENKLKSTHFTVMANGPVAFVKDATISSPSLSSTDPQVGLGAPITKISTLTGVTGAPTALDSTVLGFTPQTTDPSFNPRGLPCSYSTSTGQCTANVGFVFYFTDARPLGKNAWSAVSITPAGRVKVWVWNGTSWAN